MSTTIRISLNEKLERILKELQNEKYELLENPEIIRAIISEYYSEYQKRKQYETYQIWESSLPTYIPTEEEETALKKTREEIKKRNTINIRSKKELDAFLSL